MTSSKKTAKRQAESDVESETVTHEDVQGLRLLHKRLGVAYALQALAVLLITFGAVLGVPVHLNYLDATVTGQLPWFDMSLIQLLALPLAISATFHLMQAHYVWLVYRQSLRAKESPYRWLENAFSVSILLVAVGLLAGMRDAASVLMVFVLGFIVHLLGWQYERQLAAGQPQESRRTFAVLVIGGLTVALVLGGYVLATAIRADLPVYVAIAYAVGLAVAMAFGWLLRRQAGGRWPEYVSVERISILLGFAAKTALVWILFSGVFW